MARPWPFVVALAAASCTVEEVDFSDKTCPCDEGWSCDEARNRCVPGKLSDAGVDSGGSSGWPGTGGKSGAGGSSGTGGFAGIAGSGGTGACASTQKLCSGFCVSNSDPTYGCTTTFCDPCPKPPNGTALCSQGACVLGGCDIGWDDCDGTADNGCEFQANTDTDCGACGRTCSLANALSTSCQNAQCAPACNSGFLDCETPPPSAPDDGCETSPQGNDQHCGSCANNCSTQGASGGFECNGTTCGCTASSQCALAGGLVASCNASIGRCVCGSTTCNPGEACNKVQGDSRCRCNGGGACTSGQTCCPGSGCANLATDPFNCGACGRQCSGGQSCSSGTCL